MPAYIKRDKDGWLILHPDPGWVTCPPDCKACGKGQKHEAPLIESRTRFPTAQAAIEEALAWYSKDVQLWRPKDAKDPKTKG